MLNNEDAIRQAMLFAQTQDGQQLIRMLQASNNGEIQKAMASASSGDYAGAKQALSAILNNPEAQKLLHKLGGTNGSDGR